MADMPERSNFYSILRTDLSPKQIARLYEDLGWRTRKCSWTDYELVGPAAELVIKDDSPLLMHGVVADVELNVETVLAPLRKAGVSFAAECYGVGQELLQTIDG